MIPLSLLVVAYEHEAEVHVLDVPERTDNGHFIHFPEEDALWLSGSSKCWFSPDGVTYMVPKGGSQFEQVHMTLEGGAAVSPIGVDPVDTKYNFFFGDDPDQWRSDLVAYQEVVYEEVYPNIDLHYFMADTLKYEFHVRPGGDPDQIAMVYDGADLDVQKISGSEVAVNVGRTGLNDAGLVSFQDDQIVRSEFHVNGNRVTYEVGDYDRAKTLVIDPNINFSSFLGQSGEDSGYDIVSDEDGYIYVGGLCAGNDFPTTVGAYDTTWNGNDDVFVSKFTPDGKSLIWSTYMGTGSQDICRALEVNDNGTVFLCGWSWSSSFPVTSGAYDSGAGNCDVFAVKLNKNGNQLDYAASWGGTAREMSYGIAIDQWDNAHVVGYTASMDADITTGAYQETFGTGTQDSFVLKISSDGSSMIYGTFLGGAGNEWGFGIDVDSQGNAVTSGYTESSDFPSTPGTYKSTKGGGRDCYIMKLNPAGTDAIWGTFLGGGGNDWAYDMELTLDDEPVVAGFTYSSDYPTTSGVIQIGHGGGSTDGFVTKMNADGTALVFSTYIGGSGADVAFGVGVDVNGNVGVSGDTSSSNFPTSADAYQSTYNDGGSDGWIAYIMNEGTELTYSTYLGGTLWDDEFHGSSIAADGGLLATGLTTSNDYPTTAGAFDTTNQGGDAIFVRFDLASLPSAVQNFALDSGDEFVNLSWSEPTDNGGTAIIEYRILRYIDPGTRSVFTTTNQWYNDTGLTNGLVHYYQVIAVNAVGDSPASLNLSATPLGLPSEPTGLIITVGDSTADLQWMPPADDGGAALKYTVYRGPAPMYLEQLITNLQGTMFNDTGLTNGETYFYAVSAFNVVGEGPFSLDVNGTPLTLPSLCRTPLAIATDSMINISWVCPEDDGGDSEITYTLKHGTDPGSLTLLAQDLQVTEYNITGLTNGETKYFELFASNQVGDGPSVTFNATPYGLPSAPVDFEIITSEGSLNLTWAPPNYDGGDPELKYTIYRGLTPADVTKFAGLTTDTYHLDDRISKGKSYYYEVTASNVAGEGPGTEVLEGLAVVLPGPPKGLAAQTGDSHALVTWEAPFSDGGWTNLTYTLYRDGGKVASDLSVLEYNATGLTNGQTYKFTVTATNPSGEGPLSEELDVLPLGLPSVPKNIRVEVGENWVKITWDPVDDDGGDPNIIYSVYRGEDKNDMWRTGGDLSTTEYNDTGLNMGTTYWYSVGAANSAGEGERSIAINATPTADTSGVVTDGATEDPSSFQSWIYAVILIAIILLCIIVVVIIIMVVLKMGKQKKEEPVIDAPAAAPWSVEEGSKPPPTPPRPAQPVGPPPEPERLPQQETPQALPPGPEAPPEQVVQEEAPAQEEVPQEAPVEETQDAPVENVDPGEAVEPEVISAQEEVPVNEPDTPEVAVPELQEISE